MLIVVGSRRNGNSLALAKLIKSELDKDRIRTDIIVPGDQRIHICTGCMDCDATGVCDFIDDMKRNIELIKKEDVIMFITPVRWNLLSGDIKIFMDRLNPLYARRELAGKKAIVVSIGAKPKDVYSSFEAGASIRNFIEAAEMECVLTWEFNDCKDDKDLMEKREDLQTFVENVRKKCI